MDASAMALDRECLGPGMDAPARIDIPGSYYSEQRLPDSITVALDIIDDVIFLSRRIQINLRQCRRLVDFYRRARPFFNKLKRSGVSVQEQLYENALDALDKGRCLINGYVERNWLTSIENTGVNQDAFARTHVKLEDCFRAICKYIEAGGNHYAYHEGLCLVLGFDIVAPLYLLDNEYRATQFERDAQMDKKHMLEILAGFIINTDLIERIESTTITTNTLRAALDREEALVAEALLKNKEANVVLMKKLVEEKKEAEERLSEKNMLVAAEILRREEVEQELLELKLVLLRKEFESVGKHEMKKLPLSAEESLRATHTMVTTALGIIDSVIYFGGCIRINLRQCQRLVDFYKEARQFFDVLKRYAISIDEQLHDDTLDVLKEGQHLVYNYVEANWQTSMKMYGVNQDAFARLYVKLEDCFWVICAMVGVGMVVNHHKGSYPPIEFGSLAPLYFLDGNTRATLFHRDAQMDQEHMLEMIKGSSTLEYDKENMIQKIESTNITIQGLKAHLERPEPRCYELLKKKQLEELLKHKEAERKKHEEAEREKQEEEERKKREEAERKKREEAERKKREEAERKEREEAERKEREEAERKEREEAERKEREEAERKEREEAERKKREGAERKKREGAERKKREGAERKKREGAERKKREEAERKKQVERVKQAESSKEGIVELLENKKALRLLRAKEALYPQDLLREKGAPSSSTGIDLLQDFKIQSSEIQIGDRIGSGGFATIHKCQWQHHDYALKMFKAADVEELRTEVQNLVLLPRHPNVVLLVGFSIQKTDGSPMLLMELLDGDLHTLVCKGEEAVETKKKHGLTTRMSGLFGRNKSSLSTIGTGLSTPIKIDFIYQIAKGMLFLHKRKVFHGDLKAKNVLVKQRPGDSIQLKITDFGLSEKLILERPIRNNNDSDEDFDCSSFSNHSSLGVRCIKKEGNVQRMVFGNVGTVRWMAPEVYGISGTVQMKPYSMKADVYSFAMTCVEILTGQHPFPHIALPKNVKVQVSSGERPNLSSWKNDIPKALLHLVQRCWNANPSRRPDFSEIYSSMQKLKEAFPIK